MKKKFLKDEKYEIRAFFKKALISQFRCKDTLYFLKNQIILKKFYFFFIYP
jgi:hypothetical protein